VIDINRNYGGGKVKEEAVTPIGEAFACMTGTGGPPKRFLHQSHTLNTQPIITVRYNWHVSYSVVLSATSKTGTPVQEQVNPPVTASLGVVDTQRGLGS